MTTQPQGGGVIPEWTRGERLAKARRLMGLNTKDFAVAIGVSQKTVNNAEADETVKPITLKMWALTTGVNLEWLETGEGPRGGPTPTPPSGEQRGDQLSQLTEAKRSRARSTSRHADTARELVAA